MNWCKPSHQVEAVIRQKLDTHKLTSLLKDRLTRPASAAPQLAIPTFKGKEFIDVADIIRCEADGHCTHFYLAKERKVISSKNLGTYEALFAGAAFAPQARFLRIHHSHLINLAFIKAYDRYDNLVQMKNGDKVPIAKRRKNDFINWLKDGRLR